MSISFGFDEAIAAAKAAVAALDEEEGGKGFDPTKERIRKLRGCEIRQDGPLARFRKELVAVKALFEPACPARLGAENFVNSFAVLDFDPLRPTAVTLLFIFCPVAVVVLPPALVVVVLFVVACRKLL